ncbi:MAG TPA: hypothetical protein ENI23_08535 [bacterium]|nr:hypothetical protein [bacterium]
MEKESKEKMDYLKELSKKKINQFTQRLERYDRWRRSKYSIEKATNWMLAINTGTLFLLVANLDKFVVSSVMPAKSLFLLSAFFLGFSVMVLAFFRAILYLREFVTNHALEDIEGLPDRARLNIKTKTKEEIKEMIERISKRSVIIWGAVHNLIPRFLPLIVFAVVSYVLGVLLLTIYVIIFIVKYI